jgi:DNA polymerase III subunit alpha
MKWIPLHVHSQYSILDSTISVKDIAKKAQEYGMASVAITDSGNMHGVVDFYKSCQSAKVKPILGCEMWVAKTSRFEKKRIYGSHHAFSVVLLVKNEIGYKNLCKLSSIGYKEGFYYYPRIDKEILREHSEGLICLSGSSRGSIADSIINDDEEGMNKEIEWFLEVFKDDFYLEIQRHHMDEDVIKNDKMKQESWVWNKYQDFIANQEKIIDKLVAVSSLKNIDLVATNDSHYIKREDWQAHEILLNIQSGEPCEIWERDSQGNPKNRVANPKRKIYSSHEFYFKTQEEMIKLFEDIPQAISNTSIVADKCKYDFDFVNKHYPVFVPPSCEGKDLKPEARQKAAERYLYDLCVGAISTRYPQKQLDNVKKMYPDKDPLEIVQDRLEGEFKIISSKGMCDYLLIVYDFIAWAKNKAIPVGPGRGSAAGSILAYLLGITDIEPLQLHLFFERFINPERISYPDIDVDICMDRRPEVIDYTISKYGKENVAQIITFGTMKAKMAIKDVGRVLSVPLSKVNNIAKLVPEELNMTLEKALIIDHELKSLYDNDEEANRVIDMAMRIEGSIRNVSTHAAGIIISADAITNTVPVCIAKDSDMLVTQFSMKPVEAVGMLKIDFLGLKTLTCIQKVVEFVYKNRGEKIDWSNLPLDDANTYNLLTQGKTLGVFQLESTGMQELSKQLHIDNFEEIIAVGALYRPGPMDMIPSFISRKHGREKIEIDHPWMEEILKETYGVMVYQEQVMQIASKLAGYSLGEGDVLRRAMGKKDIKEMRKQSEKFISGAVAKGIKKEIADTIFQKIERFASYGFNKSHAAAYAYLSYATAYFKANFPNEWMAALMTCDRDDLTKVAKFIREGRALSIPILPPDINEAGLEFVPTKKGIRFAMMGIKGVGQGVVQTIINERKDNAPFTSLYDFIRRIDTSKVGKKNIEVLIDAGAFDFTTWSRDAMKLCLDAMYEKASREQKEAAKGVLHLFSLMDKKQDSQFSTPPEVITPTSDLDILHKEKELLGFYLTSHPMQSYSHIISKLSAVPLKEIENTTSNTAIRCVFIIDSIKIKIASKSQRKFAILTISDGIDRYEMPVWPEMFEEKACILKENQLIYSVIAIDVGDNNSLRLQCHFLEDMTKVDESMIKQCDDVFDRVKKTSSHRKKIKQSDKAKNKNNVKKMEKQKFKLMTMDVDIAKMQLSHVVMLKNIFREKAGTVPVEIQYYDDNKKIGTLTIDAKWGIDYDDTLAQKICDIESIMSCDVQ